MRLRDLGGLIVIDFIDMESPKSQKDVENRIKDSLRHDRARVQTGKISKFGLLELSRQRLRPALSEGSHITCPRCTGTGHIRDTESSALQVLRIIQEESMKENTAALHCQVPVDVAAFLLNEKRSEVIKIEARSKVNVLLIPNKYLETPHYKLERLRHDDPRLDSQKASYAIAEEVAKEMEQDTIVSKSATDIKPRQVAAVKGITPSQPAPPSSRVEKTLTDASPASSGGMFAWLKSLFGSPNKTTPTPEVVQTQARPNRGNQQRRGRNDARRQPGHTNQNRSDTAENTSEAGGDQLDQNGQKPRRGRGQRQDGKTSASAPANESNLDQTPLENTPATQASSENGQSSEEKRRGRNRRNRGRQRDRNERSESDENQGASTAENATHPNKASVEHSASRRTDAYNPIDSTRADADSSRLESPRNQAPHQETLNPSSVPNVQSPLENHDKASSPKVPTLEVIAKVHAPLPIVTPAQLNRQPLDEVLSSVGLIWVDTLPEKLEEIRRQIAAEPKPVHLPRQAKPAQALPVGPMLLVETGGNERLIANQH
jgi:ribonuclease E